MCGWVNEKTLRVKAGDVDREMQYVTLKWARAESRGKEIDLIEKRPLKRIINEQKNEDKDRMNNSEKTGE